MLQIVELICSKTSKPRLAKIAKHLATHVSSFQTNAPLVQELNFYMITNVKTHVLMAFMEKTISVYNVKIPIVRNAMGKISVENVKTSLIIITSARSSVRTGFSKMKD